MEGSRHSDGHSKPRDREEDDCGLVSPDAALQHRPDRPRCGSEGIEEVTSPARRCLRPFGLRGLVPAFPFINCRRAALSRRGKNRLCGLIRPRLAPSADCVLSRRGCDVFNVGRVSWPVRPMFQRVSFGPGDPDYEVITASERKTTITQLATLSKCHWPDAADATLSHYLGTRCHRLPRVDADY